MSALGAVEGPLALLAWTGGPLPLLLAGGSLIVIAWATLARHPDPAEEAGAPSPHDRYWVRVIAGAALGEVAVYCATSILAVGAEGTALPILVPFAFPAPLLMGTVLGAFSGAASARRHWRSSGVVAYLGLALLSVGFIEFAWITLRGTQVGPAWVLAVFFLATELAGLGLLLLYQFYALEYLAGRSHRERPQLPRVAPDSLPAVGVQIACFNEPFAIVERCLRSVRALDYPTDRLFVQLLDDSTDAALRTRLEPLCRELGFDYRHRDHRRGFKAGALNDGMAALPPRVSRIAVVDADYRVGPMFLRRTVPYLQSDRVAWVQLPQSYWNADESPFTRLYSLADAYFYHVIQPVRHEAASSIFCGTMGVLRRSALEAVGRWDESCITEDAEVSLRLYAAGWSSVYLPDPDGAGMAPDHFPALRSQFSRWAFGGLQLLRKNLATLRSSKLSWRQRFDFLVSGAFWMDGVFLFAMAAGLIALLAAAWAGLAWSAPSPALLIGVSIAPVLRVVDGVVKTRLALGRDRRVGLREAVGVMGFWYALKLTNLRASVRALTGRRMVFARTPKEHGTPGDRGGFAALRPTWVETTIAVLIGAAALWTALTEPPGTLWSGFSRTVMAVWLGYYAVVFGAAPLLSLVARPYPRAPPASRPSAARPPAEAPR